MRIRNWKWIWDTPREKFQFELAVRFALYFTAGLGIGLYAGYHRVFP
jgi:hypothetical protein